ncbi:hypothetical protein [Methylobacterium hispanicum]|uniref:hypothetical protein n=1 Tax=Methylobacterium hispanicum TaxID=270350 RepID=UPI002F3555A1
MNRPDQISGTSSLRSDSSKVPELSGDSPELIAFALLRYLAQLEQAQSPRPQFDRTWLLDAYTECLSAVKGQRIPTAAPAPAAPTRATSARGKRG